MNWRRLSFGVCGLAAGLCIVAGCWWIYPPLGLIIAGILLLADVIHISWRRHKSEVEE